LGNPPSLEFLGTIELIVVLSLLRPVARLLRGRRQAEAGRLVGDDAAATA
jgi:hypothetical protein